MNIDDMEGLDEATRKEVEKLLAVTREKDGGGCFAAAQATIGELLIKKNKPEKAIKVWSKVKRSDNPDLYVKLQVNIGIAFRECGNIENALKSWRNVTRSDNQEAYANAQFYTGFALKEKSNNREAIEAWSNIEYLDHPDLYAKAKLNIGLVLIDQQDSEGAVVAWKSVNHSDSPEIYASTQINIGNILKGNHDNQGALQAFYNVKRDDDAIAFAHAQFNIGAILQELGDNNKAIEIWEKIIHLDDPEVYAKAQFNIGVTLYKNNNKEVALAILKSINHADSANVYAKAQYVTAKILKERNSYGDALKALCSIERSDDPETYANAELILSSLLDEVGNHTSSLEALHRIKHQDSSVAYSLAQWLIGSDFEKNGNIEKAIDRWSNINYLDNPQVYAFAQYQTGLLLIRDHVSKKYKEAEQAFINAESSYPYEAYCYRKICELIKVPETKDFGLSSLKLLNTVLDIVDILTLDFSKYSDEEKPFERKLAHYTSTYTCNLLLGNEQKATTPSLFRLNTINNVNDPSEGQLLIRKLKGIKDNNFTALDFNEEFHAFISCFTFNHDSLNQFRLYGKQDNKEASGMSLVFKKEFFQSQNFIGGLSHLSVENTSKIIKNTSTINDTKLDNIKVQASDDNEIVKYSVMRCVYLDPTSEYFHLAQRNRLTFFREFGEKRIIKNGTEQSQAEYEWGLYRDYMAIITSKFETAYNSLKTIYTEVETEISNLKLTLTSSIYKELIILLDEILLPLKYLIKHSAFREEQECRMIYITSVDRPEVTMEYGSFLYVEYKPSVKEHLDKIYIAPAALQHKRYFDHILKGVDVPVEVSGNVFR
ncbi:MULTISPECIES: tetratricopeptide repeat protein [Psychrobacter]|jgi:lipopolysaccharide biosynthesis regulator YciM|uniref:tetratricopeptide repeat protein n=1 Tax=Psychrobacter TaxID=497 RepID=UPI00257F944A|nr:tetratricopeptide repeat protein [Psychrobacter sp. UBA3068]